MARYLVALDGFDDPDDPADSGDPRRRVRVYGVRARTPRAALSQAASRSYDDGLRPSGRPAKVFRARMFRAPVPVGLMPRLTDNPPDEPGGGLAGVREPRRPKPAPPTLSMELPEPR